MDELSNECWQQNCCKKIKQKKQDGIISCWFIFKHTTHEMLTQYFIFLKFEFLATSEPFKFFN
jgi:hypothetical protein